MLKRFTLALMIAAIVMIAAGCQSGPQDTPASPLNRYFDAILAQDYATAYKQLCKADQAVVTLEDFTVWQTLYKQTEEIKSYKLGTGKELSNFKDPFGNRYPRASEFTVSQTDFVHQSQSDNTYEYTRTVVMEDGVWKISRGETADIYQHRIYYGYTTLGTMYAEAKGVEADPAKALDYFTKALDYNESDINLYFQTALLNLNLKQPAAAESLCKRALAKEPETEMASELQNLMGVALVMQEKKTDAQKAFEAAVQINPNNQNAVNNLQNISR